MPKPVTSCRRCMGHTLLEAIVATAIFVIVSVALSGVWVMYGRSLSKSAEYLAANQLARGATEGLIANGWTWIETNIKGKTPLVEENFTIERYIRGRQANIEFNATYEAIFNDGSTLPLPLDGLPADNCRITVTVRWRSDTAKEKIGTTDFNNQTTYSTWVYKKGI